MNWRFAAEPPNRPTGGECRSALIVRVGEVMTRPPLVVDKDTTLAEVAGLMLANGCGAALVVDKQAHLVGLITEADFASRERCLPTATERASHLLEEWQVRTGIREICASAGHRRVGDLMSTHVRTAGEEEPVTDVIARMIHDDVFHLPVVRDGKIVGMIARRDVLRLIAGAPPPPRRPEQPSGRADAAARLG
jgi:CBS domain-containing protein